MATSAGSARNPWMDHAKAIGIALVVYGHVARGLVNNGVIEDGDWFHWVDRLIYSFHMPLFFYLSGLLLPASLLRHGPRQVLGQKLDTVLWAYVIWSLLQGSIEVLMADETSGQATLASVLALLWQPRAQFWFLFALMGIFLLAIPLYLRRATRRWRIILFVAGVVLSLVYLPLLQPWTTAWPLLDLVLPNLVYFSFGCLCASLLDERGSWQGEPRWWLPVAASLFLLWQAWSVVTMTEEQPSHLLFPLPLALFSLVFVTSACAWLAQRISLPWLAWIGASSMSIYLMHILAGSGVRILLQKVADVDTAWIHLLLGLLLAMTLPLLVQQLLPRLRMSWLLVAPSMLQPSRMLGLPGARS